jgi:ABC-type transport system substrate-binding protein
MSWKHLRLTSFAVGIALVTALPALADETPKRGGTLTYLIPADAPPSFDGHREGTYATVHMTAPFYSVLIRVNPQNPSSTTDFVCDLCTEMPRPTDDGKIYTFKIRDGVKFHDGTPLTAADVAASWQEIIDPPEGKISARQAFYAMVGEQVTSRGIPIGVFALVNEFGFQGAEETLHRRIVPTICLAAHRLDDGGGLQDIARSAILRGLSGRDRQA